MVRVYNGCLKINQFVEISSNPEQSYEITEIGVFSPNRKQISSLSSGEVGYIFFNLKDPKLGIQSLGQTIRTLEPGLDRLPKPNISQPVVFASIFPESSEDQEKFFDAIDKILLEDPAVSCEKDNSLALGNGFRCGFLGELHLEIFQQRLIDDFNLQTIITPASVVFRVEVNIFFIHILERFYFISIQFI